MVAITRRNEPLFRAMPATLLGVFALEVRGLAAMRLGFAAILLWDLAVRATALTAHYSDAGVLPRADRLALAWDYNEPWWMSLHMLSGGALWQGALFTVAAIAAVLLLVGYRTQWMTAVSWLLLLSLHGRNPLLLQGGDVLLRCLLFWSIFVPLGARWSVDSWLGRRDRQPLAGGGPPQTPFPTAVVSVGTAAIIVQLACVYLFTALLKTSPSWRSDFSAVHYALSGDHYTSSLGCRLLAYPSMLPWLTAGSLALEWIGPLLLFVPFGRNALRLLVALAMIGFHLGLATTMTLGTFPWICIVAWIALLPPPVWNALGRFGRAFTPDKNDRQPASECSSDTTSPASPSTAAGIAIAVLLALVVMLNFNRLDNPLASVGQAPLGHLVRSAGLYQYWNMFAPGPAQCGGWLRIEGEIADGTLVNLQHPALPLADEKPQLVSATYPTQHWRRCLVTLWEYPDQAYRESVLRYFIRRWNAEHPRQPLAAARIVQMIDPTPPPGEQRTQGTRRHVLAEWFAE